MVVGVKDSGDFEGQMHCSEQVLQCKGQKQQQMGWEQGSSRMFVFSGAGQLHCQSPKHPANQDQSESMK